MIPNKEKVLLLRLTEIFKIYGTGIVTGRNQLALKNSREEIYETVKMLADENVDDEKVRDIFQLGEDTRDWQVSSARKDLKEFGIHKENIVPVLYRPFFPLFTYYTGKTRGFHCMPRTAVMSHMLKNNLCLITSKAIKDRVFSHAFISRDLVDSRVFTQCGYVFPLFLYRKNKDGSVTKKSNLKLPGSIKTGRSTLKDGEALFYFIYGVLFSNTYRKFFENILKISFPLVPYTRDKEAFQEISKLGEKLAALHLMNCTQPLKETFKKYCCCDNVIAAESEIIDVDTDLPGGYRFKIPRKVWEFQLGGHQILKETLGLKKWEWSKLSRLSQNEVMDFLKIIRVVELTIELQEKIDNTFKKIIGAQVIQGQTRDRPIF
jgi:predicted helicase